jgi:microcystin-dependent protein
VAQPYVGEIRMFGGNFAPAGWMFCAGQLLPISEYETLFNLIGTTYGGDGQTTFGLPNLCGRAPLHQGNGFVLAQTGGVEQVTLTLQQYPNHNHSMLGSQNVANSPNASGNVVARSPQEKAFINSSPSVAMASQFLLPYNGGSQPHDNMQPYLCVSFIISLFGIYPSPT